MIRYVALLRGINVGGKRLMSMKDLSRVFESLRFKNVRTYLQSGNVIFDAAEVNPALLCKKIEKKLQTSLGHAVPVLVRTLTELKNILNRDPFKKITPDNQVMMVVTFLFEEPNRKPKLPLVSAVENLEVLAIKDRAAFVLCHRKKTGWFGFPNNFVEKHLEVSATTRQWTTVKKMVALALTQQ